MLATTRRGALIALGVADTGVLQPIGTVGQLVQEQYLGAKNSIPEGDLVTKGLTWTKCAWALEMTEQVKPRQTRTKPGPKPRVSRDQMLGFGPKSLGSRPGVRTQPRQLIHTMDDLFGELGRTFLERGER